MAPRTVGNDPLIERDIQISAGGKDMTIYLRQIPTCQRQVPATFWPERLAPVT